MGIAPLVYYCQHEDVQVILALLPISAVHRHVKTGVGGTGRNILDHQKWTNAYFASMGLFIMYEAHAEASRPR